MIYILPFLVLTGWLACEFSLAYLLIWVILDIFMTLLIPIKRITSTIPKYGMSYFDWVSGYSPRFSCSYLGIPSITESIKVSSDHRNQYHTNRETLHEFCREIQSRHNVGTQDHVAQRSIPAINPIIGINIHMSGPCLLTNNIIILEINQALIDNGSCYVLCLGALITLS